MSLPSIRALRVLRERCDILNAALTADLRPFLHANATTFRRLPTDSSTAAINVTSSCTALMALALARQLTTFYRGNELNGAITEIVNAKWESSGLPPNNPFTTSLVLRAVGVLVSRQMIPQAEARGYAHDGQALEERALEIATDPVKKLAMRPYDLAPTIVYWYVDAIDNLGIDIGDDAWRRLSQWTHKTFVEQLSLITASHDTMMDPIAMAMSACLAARLDGIARRKGFRSREAVIDTLVTDVELVAAVQAVFRYQTQSGVWPKYFPLFHYPDAGANYTFTFELLEAILKEFPEQLLAKHRDVFKGFARAVTWCETNRLRYSTTAADFGGWNSGGQIITLRKGLPESWATAVVHMFLRKLRERLSESIQRRLIGAYSRPIGFRPEQTAVPWDRQIDSPVILANTKTTLKAVIKQHVLDTASLLAADEELHHARSGLLFGPPGTSKTTVVRAIASYLGWPYLEINPSHFLRDGLNGIYTRADTIFRDLEDLSHVVVLFDEMDALVQRRVSGEAERLDVTREFLTTSMLPKLAKLYDRRQVLFFMATNHQSAFDEAIKRPGRFDLLLHVAPPLWRDKIASIQAFVDTADDRASVDMLKQTFGEWTDNSLGEQLNKFTFGELKALLNDFRGSSTLTVAVSEPAAEQRFKALVNSWSKNFITLRKMRGKYSTRREFEDDEKASMRQF
jgi:hypothetical protein